MNNKNYRKNRYESDEDFRERTKKASKNWREKNPEYLKNYYKKNKDKFKKNPNPKKRIRHENKTGSKYEELLRNALNNGFKNVAEFLKFKIYEGKDNEIIM